MDKKNSEKQRTSGQGLGSSKVTAAAAPRPDSNSEGHISQAFFDKWFEEVKQSYLQILAQLEFDLGPDFQNSMVMVRGKIDQAQDTDQLAGLQPEIEELVRFFVRYIFDEREKAASFVTEVIQRLAELELHILNSVGHAVKLHQSGEHFSVGFVSEINQVSNTVRTTQRLDRLKGLVLDKLNSFRETIESQRSQEKTRLAHFSHELDHLRKNFHSVKDKLTWLEEENKSLADKIRIDPLTAVYNRRAMEDRLDSELQRFSRYQRPFALIIFDIDRFKSVNDNFGHSVGDKCLQEVAKQVAGGLRKSDMLARFGGDEFVVVLPEADAEQAETVAKKLCEIVENTAFLVKNEKVPVTLSVGLTEAHQGDLDWLSILERADKAMYQAKENGGSTTVTLLKEEPPPE